MATVAQIARLSEDKAARCHGIIERHTRVDADVSHRDRSMIIVSGQWRGRNYVELFSIPPGQFEEVIRLLQDMRRECGHGRIDAPLSFSNWVERDAPPSRR